MGGRPTPNYHHGRSKRGHTRTFHHSTYEPRIPKTNHQNPHQNAIKHLIHLVPNKRKQKQKQTPIPYPSKLERYILHPNPPPRKHNTLCCITTYRDQHQTNGLTFTPVPSYRHYFSFLSLSSPINGGDHLQESMSPMVPSHLSPLRGVGPSFSWTGSLTSIMPSLPSLHAPPSPSL